MDETRKAALLRLLEYPVPVDPVLAVLSKLGWDWAGDPVEIEPRHIRVMLDRYLSGALTADQLTDWADPVECREDIAPARENEGLKKIIFRLANPNLAGKITTRLARRLLAKIREC